MKEVVLNIEMTRKPPHEWHEKWNSRWDWTNKKYRLSEASLQYLLKEFSKTDGHPVCRYVAWRFGRVMLKKTLCLENCKRSPMKKTRSLPTPFSGESSMAIKGQLAASKSGQALFGRLV